MQRPTGCSLIGATSTGVGPHGAYPIAPRRLGPSLPLAGYRPWDTEHPRLRWRLHVPANQAQPGFSLRRSLTPRHEHTRAKTQNVTRPSGLERLGNYVPTSLTKSFLRRSYSYASRDTVEERARHSTTCGFSAASEEKEGRLTASLQLSNTSVAQRGAQ